MGTKAIDRERRRILTQVLRASTLAEIEAARQVLKAWIEDHPHETGMRDGFEQLAQLQEALELEGDVPPSVRGYRQRYDCADEEASAGQAGELVDRLANSAGARSSE